MANKEISKRIIAACPTIFGIIMLAVIIVVGLVSANSSGGHQNSTSKPAESAPSSYMEIETVKQSIDYDTTTIDDPNLEYGKTEVRTNGVAGEKTLTYEITYENNKEVSRKYIKEEITKQPVTKVIANGTRIMWHCIDTTSFNKNPYDDNRCTSSTGEVVYVSDSQSVQLDPSYSPGKSGNIYYNSF